MQRYTLTFESSELICNQCLLLTNSLACLAGSASDATECDSLSASIELLCSEIEANFRACVAYLHLGVVSDQTFGKPSDYGQRVLLPDGSVKPGESGPLTGGSAAERREVIARLGSAVQFVVQYLRSGDASNRTEFVLGLFPLLLALQEMPDTDLQPLGLEGKTALALLKYLPVPPASVATVITMLQSARDAEPWQARASSLVYSQYFWFRQVRNVCMPICLIYHMCINGLRFY